MPVPFERYAAEKTARAVRARIGSLTTVADHSTDWRLSSISSDWTRAHYGGDFHLFPVPLVHPAVSLVFVQSRDGNTVAGNPADLGGGDIDLHLIYEGLTRVAADGVLAGAATAHGDVFFSVWHPELVALRATLRLPRHPAQIVISRAGAVDLEGGLLYNVPDVRMFLLVSAEGAARLRAGLERRPWITVIPIDNDDLRAAFATLRRYGIGRISAVGGRTTATALLDAGLVQDVCLTTAPGSGGEPNTPFYAGSLPPRLVPIVRKIESTATGIRFDHLAVQAASAH